mgnify:CR=1 FL=1
MKDMELATIAYPPAPRPLATAAGVSASAKSPHVPINPSPEGVVNDINPQAPTHVLIIPKRHIATLNDLEEADLALVGRLQYTAAKLAKEAGFAEEFSADYANGFVTIPDSPDVSCRFSVFAAPTCSTVSAVMGWLIDER